ncbi:hypothetical protein GUJ93_ZPchr0008g11747 [Zizania palustris]|uniref:Uncharacterized protein n=1 Tax=Zizania palustris TaxID=103762 RepID=A0A8J5RFV0_ZIZPA|nr:hypothetical protein GUJ93_ZPchr0008g11747 [Zizania palustris]
MGLGLAALLLMLAFPSPPLLLIHHRLLPTNKTLLRDGLRLKEGEEVVKASRLALPAAMAVAGSLLPFSSPSPE